MRAEKERASCAVAPPENHPDARTANGEPIGRGPQCHESGSSTSRAERNVIRCSRSPTLPRQVRVRPTPPGACSSPVIEEAMFYGAPPPRISRHPQAISLLKSPLGPHQLALCEGCLSTLGFRPIPPFLGFTAVSVSPAVASTISTLPRSPIPRPSHTIHFSPVAPVCNACFSINA